MEQQAAAPAAAQPLSAAAASALHTCIAGMSAASWLDPGSLHATLGRAEGLLCALRGCSSLAAYLQLVTGPGGAGGPCTCVWTAGTIAYRWGCGLGAVGGTWPSNESVIERAWREGRVGLRMVYLLCLCHGVPACSCGQVAGRTNCIAVADSSLPTSVWTPGTALAMLASLHSTFYKCCASNLPALLLAA